jgi:hypothetical protein
LIVELLDFPEEPLGDGLADLERGEDSQRLVLKDLLRIEALAPFCAGAAVVDVAKRLGGTLRRASTVSPGSSAAALAGFHAEFPTVTYRYSRLIACVVGARKSPGEPGPSEARSCFEGYFVEGAGVEAVSASVFVAVLFVAPLFFVTFLCFFFVVFVPVEVGTSVVVEDLSIVAPVAGFVVVEGPVCVVVVACWAKATPNDRREAATRAEMVFFILFSNPLFLWPVRGLPAMRSAQPRCQRATDVVPKP